MGSFPTEFAYAITLRLEMIIIFLTLLESNDYFFFFFSFGKMEGQFPFVRSSWVIIEPEPMVLHDGPASPNTTEARNLN